MSTVRRAGVMKMIRIAIVEDDEAYVSQLADYLKRYQETYGEKIEITVYRVATELYRTIKPSLILF